MKISLIRPWSPLAEVLFDKSVHKLTLRSNVFPAPLKTFAGSTLLKYRCHDCCGEIYTFPEPPVCETGVKIMSFGQLSGLVAGHGDEVKLLRSVQQVAVLVRGNWVVRSECLYARDSRSDHNGVPGELMCRARDYILYMLSEGKVLERKQVATAVRLPPEELKQLLMQVARLRRNKGWELLLPPDHDFIERNPEVVERQARAWATKHRQLMESFDCESSAAAARGKSRRRESSVSGGSDLEGAARPPRPPRRRKNSSFSSDAESGAEAGQRGKREGGKGEPRKKRDSESGAVTNVNVNGKSKRTRKESSSDKCS